MTHVVDDFMTRTVHTIGMQSPLSEAHRLMNEHAIRHLPVLEGGRLVGVVSMRDLHLIETLKGVDPKEVAVEEAMAQDAYTVPPGTSLLEVTRTMAMHKYGSAVVARTGPGDAPVRARGRGGSGSEEEDHAPSARQEGSPEQGGGPEGSAHHDEAPGREERGEATGAQGGSGPQARRALSEPAVHVNRPR
jgi:acetoin utilization protein AcuB